MATADLLAIALGVLTAVNTFLAAAVTLYPPKETGGTKKWVAIFAAVAGVSIILIVWQQQLGSSARAEVATKTEQYNSVVNEFKNEMVPLAAKVHSDSEDPNSVVKAALSRIEELEGATERKCEAARNKCADELIARSNLRQLTGADPRESPAKVLDAAAAKIEDQASSIDTKDQTIRVLSSKVVTLSEDTTTSQRCVPIDNTIRWKHLTDERLRSLSYDLSEISKDGAQPVWVTSYKTEDSQGLRDDIAKAFRSASWKQPFEPRASPDGQTFGIAVYGSGDPRIADRIIRALKNATGIDAVHLSKKDEASQPSPAGKPAQLTLGGAQKSAIPNFEGFEIAVGCRPEDQ